MMLKKALVVLLLLVTATFVNAQTTITLLADSVREKMAIVNGVIDNIYASGHYPDGVYVYVAFSETAGGLNMAEPYRNQLASLHSEGSADTGFVSIPFSVYIDGRYNYEHYLEPGATYFYFAWYRDSTLHDYVISPVSSFTLLPSQMMSFGNYAWNVECRNIFLTLDAETYDYAGSVYTRVHTTTNVLIYDQYDYIEENESEDIEVLILNLNPGTEYYIEVEYTTFNGEQLSNYFNEETEAIDEPEMVIDDVTTAGSITKIKAEFEAHCADVLTELWVYQLLLSRDWFTFYNDGPVNRGQTSNEVTYYVHDLPPGEYKARVRAVNNTEEGEWNAAEEYFTILGITGIAELEAGQIALYPNPATEHVTVYPYDLFTPYTIIVSSMEGKQLIEVFSAKGRHIVPVGELSTGTYLVTVIQEGTPKMVQKVAVMK